MKKKRIWSFILLLSFFLIIWGCGGGGGGGGDSSGQNPSPASPASPTPTAPKFSGFDFTLKEGDFWEYSWDYDYNYSSSFGGSSSKDAGTFRVTLGNLKQIGGVTAYEVLVSGKSAVNANNDFTPRWKYLALDKYTILGSEDGTTMVTLFDANTGVWPGSGFFTKFTGTLYQAKSGTISNNYVSGPAIVVGESFDKSQCTYFPGVGTICGGDMEEGVTKYEYYKENIGPLGYYSDSHIGDMTSYDWWSASTTKNVGLVACSLRGDTVNYDFETEPNDSPDTAQAATFSREIRGNGRYEDRDQSTTVNLNEIQEIEPNDSRTAPQVLGFPAYVKGAANQTDTNSSFQFYYQNVWNTISAEDWYSFTLSAATPLTIELNFPGSTTADLDLYLFPVSSSTPTYYSVQDNPNPLIQSFKETIQVSSLAAGTYIIAVDAFLTPGGSASYTLDISNTGKKNEVTVEDWYSFTLSSQATVTISLTFDDSRSDVDLYLFDQGATTLLGSSQNGAGLQESITKTLNAGTYKVGVDLVNQWNAQYTLTIQ